MFLSKYRVFVLIAYTALMPPLLITNISSIKIVLNIFQVLLFLYYGIKIFKKSNKLPKLICASVVYALVPIVASFIHSLSLYDSLVFFINLIGFSMFFLYEMEENFEQFLHNTRIYYEIVFYINFISIFINHILLGKHIDTTLIVTKANSISSAVIFALVIAVFEDFYNKKFSARTIIFIIMLTITELLIWSATGMVGYFTVVLYLLITVLRKRVIKINYLILFIISFAFFAVITFMGKSDLFSFFIEEVLHRDLTLTGRDVIWDFYINEIAKSPIIGFGAGYTPFKGLVAHSGWLNILLDGGFILLGFFSILNFAIHKKIKSSKSNIYLNLLGVAFFSFLIMMVAEMPSFVYFFAFYILLYFFYKENNFELCSIKKEG